jgi:hypothetical protein
MPKAPLQQRRPDNFSPAETGFFCCAAAGYSTGSALPVRGGACLLLNTVAPAKPMCKIASVQVATGNFGVCLPPFDAAGRMSFSAE